MTYAVPPSGSDADSGDNRESGLAARLAAAMRQADVNAATLARAIGVTQAAISQILSSATRTMRPENLFAAADLLRVEPRWLATGVGPMQLRREHIDLLNKLTALPDAVRKSIEDQIEVLIAALQERQPSIEMQPVPPPETISEDEKEILDSRRSLGLEQRELAVRLLRQLERTPD
jgi:transcriptional regulator with XRE-family HTH domain